MYRENVLWGQKENPTVFAFISSSFQEVLRH